MIAPFRAGVIVLSHRYTSIHEELAHIRAHGLYRNLRALSHAGGHARLDGRDVLNFSSNDYLDLANDPRLKNAAAQAAERYGCGATASRLMGGHLELHETLERRLATLVGQETALVFPTGYQGNIGVLTALAGPNDVIYSDALNHASIVDGCRISRATVQVYPHRDVDALRALLQHAGQFRRRIIVTDSVFSMDGDEAPVAALADVAREHDAFLIVDEAHAIGVFGHGGGLCREAGVTPDVTVGTLSKALGGEGGFAACEGPIRELMINKARSFIFSTGLAPACAGSAVAALGMLNDNPDLGATLLQRVQRFRDALRVQGIDVPPDRSPIVPIIIGDNEAAVALAGALLQRDVLAAAVRPPSVPAGTARLRFSITRAHTEGELIRVAEIVAETMAAVYAVAK